MSTRKITVGESSRYGESRKFRIDQIDESAQRPLQNIEMTSLEIEPDYAADCDPYNNTGQFCLINTRREPID